MEFTRNPALNNKYIITATVDHEIQTPDGYKGLLTRVATEQTLDGMISRGSVLVKLKPATTVKETKAS